jgi:hypothetical protein
VPLCAGRQSACFPKVVAVSVLSTKAPAVLLTVALGLGACATPTETLDARDVESAVERQLDNHSYCERLGRVEPSGAAPDKHLRVFLTAHSCPLFISCPGGQPAEPGFRFSCHVNDEPFSRLSRSGPNGIAVLVEVTSENGRILVIDD